MLIGNSPISLSLFTQVAKTGNTTENRSYKPVFYHTYYSYIAVPSYTLIPIHNTLIYTLSYVLPYIAVLIHVLVYTPIC